MKKGISILLLLILLVSLLAVIGCGGTKEATNSGTVPSESATQPLPPAPTPPQQPQGIPWDQAPSHIGETTTVYGPIVGTRWASSSKGQPTFLDIGNAYPNPNRFTVLIWVENRGNFPSPPESYYSGKTISVTGLITEYQGVPQMEVASPSQIQSQ